MPEGARLEALDQWIRMGGRLVLCVGSRADEVLAQGSALRRFAPGRLEKIVALKSDRGVGSVCRSFGGGAARQRAANQAFRRRNWPMWKALSRPAKPICRLSSARRGAWGRLFSWPPIWTRGRLANGPIVHCLWQKCWTCRPRRGEQQPDNAAFMHNRYTDLSGQLRSALDEFTGVRTIPFSLVALLIIFYILLIGPGDYFFLRKIVRRMEWTWLSFPIIVVAVSGAAYVLAYYLKGDQLRVNQADLVDVDAASGFVRGATWLNIFSPRMETFNLSLQPRLPDGRTDASAQSWFAWLGLQGGALGGMNPRGANPTLWPEHYSFCARSCAMLGVPIQVWSTKSFTGRWSASTARLSPGRIVRRGAIAFRLDYQYAGVFP